MTHGQSDKRQATSRRTKAAVLSVLVAVASGATRPVGAQAPGTTTTTGPLVPSADPSASSQTDESRTSSGASTSSTSEVAAAPSDPVTRELVEQREAAQQVLDNFMGEPADLDHYLMTSSDFRESFGIPASREQMLDLVVRSATDDTISTDLITALTAEERARVGRQLDIQNALSLTQDQIAERLGDSFGGVYVDQTRGGEVTIKVAGTDSPPDESIVSDLLPPATPITIAVAPASFDQLEEIRSAVLETFRASGAEFTSVGLNPRLSQIEVVTPQPMPNIADDLSQQFGERISFEVAETYRALYSRTEYPLYSGSRIRRRSDNAGCTAGPYVTGNASGLTRVLTAGHCLFLDGGSPSVNWRVGGQSNPDFGSAVAWSFSQNANSDGAALSVNPSYIDANCVIESATTCRAYGGHADPAYGASVIISGATSGKTQGTVTDASAPVNVEGTVIEYMFITDDVHTLDGDSGGAVYGLTSKNYAKYYGSLSGGNPVGSAGSPISRLENTLGVHF